MNEALGCLNLFTLKRLCRAWELRVSGSKRELKERLAETLAGDLDALLKTLQRAELLNLLEQVRFTRKGREGALIRIRDAAKGELIEVARQIFGAGWKPETEEDTPAPQGSVIRIVWSDTPDMPDTPDPEALPEILEDAMASAVEPSDEQQLWDWLDQRLAGREQFRPKIKTLVNKLGRHQAQQRLHTKSVQELGEVLSRGGFFTDIDLAVLDRSPGIDATVRIWREDTDVRRTEDTGTWSSAHSSLFRPVPVLSEAVRKAEAEKQPGQLTPLAELSHYQLACLELQFVVSVAAASVHRLDQQARDYAVQAVTQSLTLGAADTIRLRGMAHKYSAGSEDVQPSIRELRVLLDVPGRQRLLDIIRAIAPPSPMLEDMLAAYAIELGIPKEPFPGNGDLEPSTAAPPAANAVAEAAISAEIPAPAAQGEAQPVHAGGLRANQLLDEIFQTDTRKS